jgi:chromosome segregation ATPase
MEHNMNWFTERWNYIWKAPTLWNAQTPQKETVYLKPEEYPEVIKDYEVLNSRLSEKRSQKNNIRKRIDYLKERISDIRSISNECPCMKPSLEMFCKELNEKYFEMESVSKECGDIQYKHDDLLASIYRDGYDQERYGDRWYKK